MKQLQTRAIIINLIHKLKAQGSWCGETHIQKASYFLEQLFDLPLGFEFIFYKHGPYSFDLSDELNAMQINSILETHPQVYPYGPRVFPAEQGILLMKHFPQTIKQYEQQIDYVTRKLGNMGVAELERLATALYVTKNNTEKSIEFRSQEINKVKPHITIEQAKQDLNTVDTVIEETREMKNGELVTT